MQAAQRHTYSGMESGALESSDMPKMIAENIFRDLKSYGLDDKDIVAVSSELLSRLSSDIRVRTTEKE
jgi:hypothetical protein